MTTPFPLMAGTASVSSVAAGHEAGSHPEGPPMTTDSTDLANTLAELAEKATPRPWDLRSYQSGTVALVMREWPAPNEYGSGYLSAHMTAFNIGEQDEAAIDREKFVNADLLRTLVNNLPTIIAALRSARPGSVESDSTDLAKEKVRSALERCSELFSDIRGDWSDPRSECREGQRLIEEALAALSQVSGRETVIEECAVDLVYTDTDGVEHTGLKALREESADILSELGLIVNCTMDQGLADLRERIQKFHAKAIRALSDPAGRKEGWRPMSTAPTDGTLFVAGLWVTVASSRAIHEYFEQHIIRYDDEADGIHPDFEQAWGWDDYTHWMPLRAPPSPEKDAASTGEGR